MCMVTELDLHSIVFCWHCTYLFFFILTCVLVENSWGTGLNPHAPGP